MHRKFPPILTLAFASLALLDSAIAQWPNDQFLNRLPSTRISAANELPELITPAPNVLPVPSETLPVPDATSALEELPADEGWESWIMPSYWFDLVGWEGSFELGINGTSGNSESASFIMGAKLKRKTKLHETTFDANYVNTRANGIETQNNAIQNLRYERSFDGSRWTFFTREYLEYDEFKAFDLRLALNAGAGYKFIDTDATTLKGRYGAGVSHEIGGPNNDWVPELLYGVDFKRQLTTWQKLELTVDYFPEWGNFRNYRAVTQFAWEVALSEKHNLNLKLSVNDRYDSTPQGLKPNDINYGLLLLWKL